MLDVVASGAVVTHADDGNDVERAVGYSVAAAAESVPAGGSAAAGRLWCDSAALGEGGLAVDSLGVVAGGDQELAGDFDADTVQFDELGSCGADGGVEVLVKSLDLFVERLPAPGQVA